MNWSWKRKNLTRIFPLSPIRFITHPSLRREQIMVGKGAKKLMMALLLLTLPSEAISQETGPEDYFEHMEWRSIGPAVFGGRIPDVEADRSVTETGS